MRHATPLRVPVLLALVSCSAPVVRPVTNTVIASAPADAGVTDVAVAGPTISGRVMLDGHPVAYFGISITPSIHARLVRPIEVRAADGTFRVPIAAGTWDVIVAGPGFAPVRLADNAASAGGLALGDIVVGHGITLRGIIRDATGTPVPDARVVISAHGSEGGRGELADLADGTFATATDSNGRYELRDVATLPRVASRPQIVAHTRDHRASLPTLVPAVNATIDLSVHPTGRLEVTIASFPNVIAVVRAVADPRVTLSSDPMPSGERFTLPVGDYDIELIGPTPATSPGVVQRATVVAGATTAVALAGPVLTPVALELHVGRQPCNAIAVAALGASTPPVHAACGGPDIRIATILPGHYRVCLEGPGQRRPTCQHIAVQTTPSIQWFDLTIRP